MISFKKINKIAFLFLFLFVLTACTNRPTGGFPTDSEIELSENDDENINLKLKYYNNNCINLFSGQMKMLRHDYVEAVNIEVGPEDKENVPSLFELDPTGDCALAIAKANELQFAQELDPLAEDFLVALQEAAPLIAEATQYYDQMDYESDDLAKGKELHPQLMKAFEHFEKADTNFRKAIQKIQDAVDLRFLESYKEESKDFEFLVQDEWMKGKIVLNKAEAESYETLNVEEFTAAVNKYQAALEALDAYLAKHPNEAVLAEEFQTAAGDFMTEAKQLMNRKSAGLPYDTFEGNAKLMRNEYEWWEEAYFL